jgi:MbtH protein
MYEWKNKRSGSDRGLRGRFSPRAKTPIRGFDAQPEKCILKCVLAAAQSTATSRKQIARETSAMSVQESDDGLVYAVVFNQEEQYSIWPIDKEIPPGWRSAGKEGKKSECLRYIEEVWTDMRPLRVRQT